MKKSKGTPWIRILITLLFLVSLYVARTFLFPNWSGWGKPMHVWETLLLDALILFLLFFGAFIREKRK